jgi:methionyl-tRNA synthetase
MLRYFLATRGPLGVSDSQFSAEIYAEVYNADLANTYGNSCSRVGNMIGKYFDGRTPQPGAPVETQADYDSAASEALTKYLAAFDRLDLSGAGDAALGLVRSVDAYIDETRPFTLAKDDANLPQVATILYNCAEALRIATVLLWPFLPDKCAEQLRRMGFGEIDAALAAGEGELEAWCQWGLLEPGTPIEKGDALFPRYDTKRK